MDGPSNFRRRRGRRHTRPGVLPMAAPRPPYPAELDRLRQLLADLTHGDVRRFSVELDRSTGGLRIETERTEVLRPPADADRPAPLKRVA